MVLDSPFTSLVTLANELVVDTKMGVPSMLVGVALKVIRTSVMKKAQFDIEYLSMI